MNKVFNLINKHRTIRAFQDKAVDENTVQKIFEAAMRTPTALGLQQVSIIRVKDQDKKNQIATICNQAYVAEAPELLIFIVDLFRNYKIAEASGETLTKDSFTNEFLFGLYDALLMTQNINNMVESLDMGGVMLGSILNGTDKLIELLELPKLTFPVIGFAFGYPDQDPALKPRMKSELRVFEDSYKIQDDYKEAIKEHDKEMNAYYDLRDTTKTLDTFSKQALNNMQAAYKPEKTILDMISEHGFNF